MGSKFIVVAGNGETTRSNIEALITDFFYDKPKDYVLLLPFIDRPSQGQVWAHQIFQELGMTTTALAPEQAIVINLGGLSFNTVADPMESCVEAVKGEEAYVFALVDEDHPIDLSGFTEAQVPCFNLCMGLLGINAVEAVQRPVEAAIQPVVESVQEHLFNQRGLEADIAQLLGEFSTALVGLLKEHGAIK